MQWYHINLGRLIRNTTLSSNGSCHINRKHYILYTSELCLCPSSNSWISNRFRINKKSKKSSEFNMHHIFNNCIIDNLIDSFKCLIHFINLQRLRWKIGINILLSYCIQCSLRIWLRIECALRNSKRTWNSVISSKPSNYLFLIYFSTKCVLACFQSRVWR